MKSLRTLLIDACGFRSLHFTTSIILGSLLVLSAQSSVANSTTTAQYPGQKEATEFKLCSDDEGTGIQHLSPRAFSTENIEHTIIGADSSHSDSDGSSSLDGNVIIEKHLLRVTADHANYDKNKEILSISGNVNIVTESISLKADSGTVDMASSSGNEEKQAEFTNIQFILPDSNMKGKAETITTNDGTDGKKSTLIKASITSCSLVDPDWLVSADEMQLDHDDEYGTAEDVVVRFKGVPFLYTPYIEFPTSDKRRSGLLFPEIDTSSSRGVELAVPWYWNIAPNQDAVFTPHYMERRGFTIDGNYRYLTQSTEGQLQAAYVPNDALTQEDRYQVNYKQRSILASNLLLNIDLHDVSDADYFNDFANDLDSTSQTHLNRSANLHYNLNNWRLNALVQDIKTIDKTTPITDRPYGRLPQLTFNGDTEIGDSSIFFTLNSEYVAFSHDDATKVTGSRATVRPGLRLSLGGAAWFFNPEIKFSHTQYDVGSDGNPDQPGTSQPVRNRNLPISSIDTGLYFERSMNSGYQQTLEPRLYYLNVPFADQSNTPIFDTSIPNFSVAQLFRDNRFIGGDRIGDANQLTLALTSRILNTNTGDEFLRASIGQIYYFEDRKVSLDGTVDTAKQSDIIAELGTNWGRWKSNINLQWNTTDQQLSQENYFLHYKSDERHLFNIGYRTRQDAGNLGTENLDIEQTDTSFVYGFTDKYSGFGRWNYSLKDNKDIDIIAGIAYDSCCWSIQVLAQRRLKNVTESTIINDDAYDNSILIQFVFKGFGSLSGSKARTTLERSIYGYTDVLQ